MILGAPAGALATTFYVDDSATTPHPNCINSNPANACLTINDAITQSRVFMGPDTIMVAAGNYPEGMNLNDDEDAGLTIDGAGTSTTGSGTVIQLPTSTNIVVLRSNITIRDMAILASNSPTLLIGGLIPSTPSTGQSLRNVTIELNDQANISAAIHVQHAIDPVLSNILVNGDAMWDGDNAHALKVAQSTNVLLTESRLLSNSVTLFSRASTLTVNRSLIAGPFDLADFTVSIVSDLMMGLSSLTMDDSVVALGSRGIHVETIGSTSSATATIRNSTIDAGMPKGTPDLVGVGVQRVGPVAVDIDNSIVVGSLVSAGPGFGGSTACTYSDVESTVSDGIVCLATPGNPGNNSSSTPASLFVPGGFLGLDWHLLPNSPAIDTGSPGALAVGEPTADFDGNPRVLDGNLDCVARRDKGAHEITGQSAPCPTPPGANPGGGGPGGSSGKKSCKKKKGKKAAAAKKKRCKKKKKR